jgi:hypothetical protein
MWTPPINESAELTRGALKLILYSEVPMYEYCALTQYTVGSPFYII